jgi:branched-chain amino acid transport system substrate-binding protein
MLPPNLAPAAPAPGRSRRLVGLLLVCLSLSLLLCSLGGYRVVQPILYPPTATPPGGVLTIVADLPLTGSAQTETQAIARAIQLRLEQAGGTACGGHYGVTYEAWDDASAATGEWDPAAETANARRAAADPRVIAYLGPYDSGAAKLSIPLLDLAGPLVMISMSNTYPGLTKTTGAAPGEPDVYYPAGLRNYVRLTAASDVQGAVAARFVRVRLQANTVYILDDRQPDGQGIADDFETMARAIGLTVLGRDHLDPTAANYQALMGRISLSHLGQPPDAIFVGMRVTSNAAQVLKDKVALMGDNSRVKYIGPAGIMYQAFIDGAGTRVAEGVYASAPGLPFEQMPPASRQFQQAYNARYHAQLTDPAAAYGYEAMNVALAAIENVCAAGGDPANRRAIRDAVFNLKTFSGALGTWSFDANGDISLTGTTFYQVTGGAFQPAAYFQ